MEIGKQKPNKSDKAKRRNSAKCNKRMPLIDLGFPKIEEISYLNLRAQQQAQQGHQPPPQNDQLDGKSLRKACLELQRKVDRLEHDKKKMALKIK